MKKKKNNQLSNPRPQQPKSETEYSLDDILDEARKLRESRNFSPPPVEENPEGEPGLLKEAENTLSEKAENLPAEKTEVFSEPEQNLDSESLPFEEPAFSDIPPSENSPQEKLPEESLPQGEYALPKAEKAAGPLPEEGLSDVASFASQTETNAEIPDVSAKKPSFFSSLKEKWKNFRGEKGEPSFSRALPDYSDFPVFSSLPEQRNKVSRDFSYLFREEQEEADDEALNLYAGSDSSRELYSFSKDFIPSDSADEEPLFPSGGEEIPAPPKSAAESFPDKAEGPAAPDLKEEAFPEEDAHDASESSEIAKTGEAAEKAEKPESPAESSPEAASKQAEEKEETPNSPQPTKPDIITELESIFSSSRKRMENVAERRKEEEEPSLNIKEKFYGQIANLLTETEASEEAEAAAPSEDGQGIAESSEAAGAEASAEKPLSRYEKHFGRPKPLPAASVSEAALQNAAEAAADKTEPAPSAKKKNFSSSANSSFGPGKKSKRFHVFGKEEETTDSSKALPEAKKDEIEDYTRPEEAFSVRAEIAGQLRSLLIRLLVTVAVGLVLLFFALSTHFGWGATSFMNPAEKPLAYLLVNNVLLFVALLFSWGTLSSGLTGLFRLKNNSDSALSLACAAVFLQGIAGLFDASRFVELGLHSYALLAVFGLFLNALGKTYLINRVRDNFKFVCSPDQKYALELIPERDRNYLLTRGLNLDEPKVAYHAKTDLLSDFLKLSYAPDLSETSSHRLASLGFICSLVIGILCFIINSELLMAFTAFAAAACVCVPMACIPAINLPIRRLCRQVRRVGGMLIGYPSIQKFSSVNSLVLDAEELFPEGSLMLHGMKTFSGQRVDAVILDAAAVICKAGGPMAPVFEQIVNGRHDLLPKVDSVSYEDGLGLEAWVGGRRILIGNRKLLEKRGITPPTGDYEIKYRKGARQLTYLATGGELVAMFVVSYLPNERLASDLQNLEDNGVCLLVRTADSNVTPRLIADAYNLYYRNIKILPSAQSEFYKEARTTSKKQSPAFFATRGERLPAVAKFLSSCIRSQSNFSLLVLLQNIGAVLGLLLVAVLTFFAGLSQLGTLELWLYLFFWVLAVFLVSLLHKP